MKENLNQMNKITQFEISIKIEANWFIHLQKEFKHLCHVTRTKYIVLCSIMQYNIIIIVVFIHF